MRRLNAVQRRTTVIISCKKENRLSRSKVGE